MLSGNTFLDIIFLVLILILMINSVFIIVLFQKLSRIRRSQKVLTELFSGETVEELLFKALEQQEAISTEAVNLKNQILQLENKQRKCFDRIGIVRYSASSDIGAKLSYSIGISNENEDGLVITGLHFRNGVNMYYKHINEGVPDIELSEEEKKAVTRTRIDKVYKDK